MVEERVEDGIRFFLSKGVFYNPVMRFSRLLSSLVVSTINDKLNLFDGFCASGIRGIRYAVENNNVKSVSFNDISKEALAVADRNAKMYDLDYELVEGRAEDILWNEKKRWNFIELDPFGSPYRYVYPAVKHLSSFRVGYLSLTATDTGVLCGIHWKATLKHYWIKPFHVYYCHEYGLRGLISFVAKIAANFNLRVEPLFSFYYKHQVKLLLKLVRGKDAHENLYFLEHIHQCDSCGSTYLGFVENCLHCGGRLKHGGPIWYKPFADVGVIERMEDVLDKRGFADAEKIRKFILVVKDEQSFPPWHYNLHALFSSFNASPWPMDKFISFLKEKGVEATRTHFDYRGFKVNAPFWFVREVVNSHVSH